MVEIKKIGTGMSKLNVEGTIKEVFQTRDVKLKSGTTSKVADASLSDSTGNITLSLWDAQIPMVKEGSKIRIENAYTSSFKGKVVLNIGKYGKLAVLEY